jgi:hypothetical protein
MPEYEAERIQNDIGRQEQELAFKARELDLRQQALNLQRSSRLTPLAAAVGAAIVAAVGGALLQGYFNLQLERGKYAFSKEIERQKLESSLIVQAVSTGRQDDSIKNLRFLLRVNLISDQALKGARARSPKYNGHDFSWLRSPPPRPGRRCNSRAEPGSSNRLQISVGILQPRASLLRG